MAMKEHPFVVTTTFQGDGETIKYDATKPGRSDAVGKAYRLNDDGKGELVIEGQEIDGIVLEVDDDHKFTGAYMFGGLLFPIGDGETVARGDKLVGALGPDSAKGYVKAADAVPSELATVAQTDVDTAAELFPVVNADRAAINALGSQAKGKGNVLEADATHALAAFPG